MGTIIAVLGISYLVFHFVPKPDLTNRGEPTICTQTPQFADYYQEVVPGPAGPYVNFSANQMAREMEAELWAATASAMPNFAGSFQLVEHNCGPYCQKHAILNHAPSDVVYFGLDSTLGLEFRPDSRLIIVNPSDEPLPSGSPRNIPRYYEFRDNTLHYICEEQI